MKDILQFSFTCDSFFSIFVNMVTPICGKRLVLFVNVFQGRVSLCDPHYPGTCSVDQAGLNSLIRLPLSPERWDYNMGHHTCQVKYIFAINSCVPDFRSKNS